MPSNSVNGSLRAFNCQSELIICNGSGFVTKVRVGHEAKRFVELAECLPCSLSGRCSWKPIGVSIPN